MLVRFATICDLCRTRSEEYVRWPTCKVCMRDVCPSCRHKDYVEVEDPETMKVVCNRCDPKDQAVRVRVLQYPSQTAVGVVYVTLGVVEEQPFFGTPNGYCVFENDLKRWQEGA